MTKSVQRDLDSGIPYLVCVDCNCKQPPQPELYPQESSAPVTFQTFSSTVRPPSAHRNTTMLGSTQVGLHPSSFISPLFPVQSCAQVNISQALCNCTAARHSQPECWMCISPTFILIPSLQFLSHTTMCTNQLPYLLFKW